MYVKEGGEFIDNDWNRCGKCFCFGLKWDWDLWNWISIMSCVLCFFSLVKRGWLKKILKKYICMGSECSYKIGVILVLFFCCFFNRFL